MKEIWKAIKFWFWKLFYRIRFRHDPPVSIAGQPSRSYLRKLWKPLLQHIDRRVNDGEGNRAFLLMERKIFVAKRKQGFIPE